MLSTLAVDGQAWVVTTDRFEGCRGRGLKGQLLSCLDVAPLP